MVPLTSSLYVPGVLDCDNKVLVEVGASYFIEQENASAQNYCLRKKAELEGNAKKIHEII
jgi:prefoldin alpha subunit